MGSSDAPPKTLSTHQQRRGTPNNPIKQLPAYLEIRLVYPPFSSDPAKITERPARKLKYVLEMPGIERIEGETNDQGVLKHKVPANATEATLRIGSSLWDLKLRIENLEPAKNPRGAQARLNNLGLFASTQPAPAMDDRAKRAVRRFATLFMSALKARDKSVPTEEEIWKKLEEIHGG